MAYQKKITRFYLKYFVRKPIGYFSAIAIGTFAIVILFLFIQVPSVETLSVTTAKKDHMCVVSLENNISQNQINKMYLYEDRNSFVYEITDYSTANNEVMFYLTEADTESVFDSNECYLEIWNGEHSLLYEIFVQGGN